MTPQNNINYTLKSSVGLRASCADPSGPSRAKFEEPGQRMAGTPAWPVGKHY